MLHCATRTHFPFLLLLKLSFFLTDSSSTANLESNHESAMATDDANDPIVKSINETKASYVRLGKSGLRVSVPILGAMSFGHKDWQPWVLEEKEALPLLKAAYDRGLNTWDTANVYSNGVSEEIIGKVCVT